MKLTFNPSLTRCLRFVATSGRSLALSLALLVSFAFPSGYARADITQAEAEMLASAIVSAFQNAELPPQVVPLDWNFNDLSYYLEGNALGSEMPVGTSSLVTAIRMTELVEKLNEGQSAWLDTVLEILRQMNQGQSHIEEGLGSLEDISEIQQYMVGAVQTIRAYVSGGFNDEYGNLIPHGIQSMLEDEAEYHSGYRTATDGGAWALSVRDDDAVSALRDILSGVSDLPDDIGATVGDRIDESLRELVESDIDVNVHWMSSGVASMIWDAFFGGEQDHYESVRNSNQPPDNSGEMASYEYDGKHEAENADEESTGHTADGNPLEFFMPDTSGLEISASQVPRLYTPELTAYRQKIRVFSGMFAEVNGMPGGWSEFADPIDWTPWGDSESDLSATYLKQAGRVMTGFWTLGFAVWLFLLVRREVVYYVTLGHTDEALRTASTTGEWESYDS